jgi:hypothetical protein
VNPVPRPTASNLWDDVFVSDRVWNNAYRRSYPNGDATSWIEWKLPIGAGTWDISITYASSPDAGIMTASLDGHDVGSVDGYSDTTSYNLEGMIHNVVVGESGMHMLRIRTDAKNDLSAGYFGYLVWVRLVQS